MTVHLSTQVKRPLLIQRARTVLQQRFKLRPGQRVLVIYDGPKEGMGKAFVLAARRLGAKVDVFRLRKNRFSPRTQQSLAKKVQNGNYHFFINIIDGRPDETKDRIELVKRQHHTHQETGGVMIHSPNLEESMLAVELDFIRISELARKTLKVLKKADKIEIRTDRGSDLQFSIKGQELHEDVLAKKRDWGNFPCGEIYCPPIESSANGTVIADGSAGVFGLLPQPLRLEIQEGQLTDIRWFNAPSSDASLLKKIVDTLFQDEGASKIGEFGLGLAPYTLCGNMLQDEKAAGTIHIAFGNNHLFGGNNRSRSHLDFLIRDPEIFVHYEDHPTLFLMRQGTFLI